MYSLIQFFQSFNVGFVRDTAHKTGACENDRQIGEAILTDL